MTYSNRQKARLNVVIGTLFGSLLLLTSGAFTVMGFLAITLLEATGKEANLAALHFFGGVLGVCFSLIVFAILHRMAKIAKL